MIGAKAMKELSMLKRELKCWENMFERTHGRKPNKDDISDGPEEIRESYRKYRELKESVSKISKEEDKQEEDDVFGKNLNKKKTEEKKSLLPFRKRDWTDIIPVRLCHGQRPKKRDSPKESVTEESVEENNIASASSGGDAKDQALSISSNIPEVKVTDTSEHKVISSAKTKIGSSTLFPGHHARNARVKKKGAISSAWLEKYKPELPENSQCNVSQTEDLVSMETCSDTLSHNEHECTYKAVNNENNTLSVTMENESSCLTTKETANDQENPLNMSITEETNWTRKSPKFNSMAISKRGSEEDIFKSEDEVLSNSKQTEAMKYFDDECLSDDHGQETTDSQQAANMRGSNVTDLFGVTNPTISNTSVEDRDCRSLDPPQEIVSFKRKAEERTTKLGKPSKRFRHEDNNEEETCDESNVDNSANEMESEEDLPKTTSRKHATNQSTSKKVSLGLVSNNFQRLNMKHHSYRRRGGGISGAAYKRRAWKQIMKSRGEFVPQKSWNSKGRGGGAGGKSVACFKCGEEGHWAKNCRGRRKQTSSLNQCEKDAEDVEVEEFEPLPTIEEAAMMAAGIQQDDDSPESEGLVILPHQLPRPVYTPPSPPPAVEPLYQPGDDKPVAFSELSKEVLSALGELGFSSFRPGQQEAVMRILCGLSSLVVLSTGAGKSLCYQLPAFLYAKRSPCLTLVISPLVSLMEDQITGLPHGLKGACLHTNLTKAQRQKVVDDLCSGKVSVLLLSPEALVGGGSGNGCLPAVSQLPQIAFACIDEAHCVSEWSHNFRPSYLRVCKVLREKFGVRCFLGLTATATRSTAASVAEHLGIIHDPGAVIRGGAVPPNLFLSVSCDSDRTQALLKLLQGRRFSQCDSIIIYCTRREQTEKLASILRTCLQSTRLPSGWDEQSETGEEKDNRKKKNSKGKGKKNSSKPAAPKWDTECYHAGLSAAQRRRVQKRFMTGQLRVVVATVAFGMGLDKPDVRAIIHYNLPRSFESYVQEIGRAGRDGRPSHCHVFLDPKGKDMCELRRHVYANTVDRSTIKKLVRQAFPRCGCKKLLQQQQERNASRYNEEALLDIEDACGDMLDSNLEAELQAVEMQYQKDVEAEACKNREENESEGVTESSDSAIKATQSDQPCASTREETFCPGPESETIEDGKVVQSEISEGDWNHQNSAQVPVQRLCGGHEVAMVIESLIQELDMREENIATLLCYLELHARRWLEVLQPVKSTCVVKFYGGHAQLRAVAQKIPPIAAAVSNTTTTPARFKKSNSITFSVVELADKMGWDLEPVCRELRALQWNTCLSRDHNLADMGQSGILVEFSDLSFHLRAPGDLSDEERDGVCDFLEDRILAEERSQLQQLQFVYDSLKSVSFSEFWQCADDVDGESDKQLKQIVRSYFEDSADQTKEELRVLAKARKGSKSIRSSITHDVHVNWDVIARDIRALLGVHHDHSFTGRAIARIFHGIDSPCYPAEVWGRDRRFWRKHLDVEFNSLRNFATQELIKFR